MTSLSEPLPRAAFSRPNLSSHDRALTLALILSPTSPSSSTRSHRGPFSRFVLSIFLCDKLLQKVNFPNEGEVGAKKPKLLSEQKPQQPYNSCNSDALAQDLDFRFEGGIDFAQNGMFPNVDLNASACSNSGASGSVSNSGDSCSRMVGQVKEEVAGGDEGSAARKLSEGLWAFESFMKFYQIPYMEGADQPASAAAQNQTQENVVADLWSFDDGDDDVVVVPPPGMPPSSSTH